MLINEKWRARQRESLRRLRERDRGHRNAYMREWNRTHHESVRATRARNIDKEREQTRRYNANARTDLRAFKLLRGCFDCGYDLNADALELDHVRGVKFGNISNMLRSPNVMATEIAKCEVRCANCHSIVTQGRRRALKAA